MTHEAGVVAGCPGGLVVSKACRGLNDATGCVCETTITCTEGVGGGNETEAGLGEEDAFRFPDEAACLAHLDRRKEMGSEGSQCAEVSCPVEFQPSCPPDAFLLASKAKPPDCCEKVGKCICHQKRCQEGIPECAPGWELRRIKEADKVPGDCCDLYACQEQRVDCSKRSCPALAEPPPCPADSERPPPLIPPGRCCPILQPCECKAGICSVAPSCPPSTSREHATRGDGTPGNCCDSFKCVGEAPNNGNWSSDQRFIDAVRQTPVGMEVEGEKRLCAHGNAFYAEGQTWNQDECTTCLCRQKLTFCQKMTCPPLPETCSWVDVPEGECCPLCMGCITEQGEKMNLTDTWAPDDCTTCSCGPNGKRLCQSQTQTCTTTCDNPRHVPGTCCPVCDEETVVEIPPVCPRLEHCPLRCEYGLERDDNGCFQCACLALPRSPPPPPDHCTPLTEANCATHCAHGYGRDAQTACPVCVCANCPPLHACYKHCLYGFRRNQAGCPICKCQARPGDEEPTLLESATNATDISEVARLGCHDGQKDRESGEWWTEGCRHCYCERERSFCSLVACPSCPEGVKRLPLLPGECCPTCEGMGAGEGALSGGLLHSHTVCHAPGTGRLYVDGETWDMHPCVACTCRVGHVLCHPQQCPPAPCAKPIRDDPLDCCVRCPADETGEEMPGGPALLAPSWNATCLEGATWRADECSSCKCAGGQARCFEEPCPPLPCNNRPVQIKGRCCPVCTDALTEDVCSYNGRFYRVGEAWVEDCANCTCEIGGGTRCIRPQCPPCPTGYLRAESSDCCPPCVRDTETQAVNLMLSLACAGLALLIVGLVLGLVWYSRRRARAHRAAKEQALVSPSLPKIEGGGPPAYSRSSSKTKSGKMTSKSLLGEEPTEALLATSDSGSSSSCTSAQPSYPFKPPLRPPNGYPGPPSQEGSPPPPPQPPSDKTPGSASPTAARASSFNLRQLPPPAPFPTNASQRPHSCHS